MRFLCRVIGTLVIVCDWLGGILARRLASCKLIHFLSKFLTRNKLSHDYVLVTMHASEFFLAVKRLVWV